MAEQEKFGTNYEQQRQCLEDLVCKRIIKLKKMTEKYKKRAEDSKAQHCSKEYQDRCDNDVKVFEGLLAEALNELEVVKQAKANRYDS